MKAIKNYSILAISTITLIFSGCSLTGPKTNPADVIPVENDPVQIANPWEEVNKSDIERLISDENAEADMYDIDTIGKLLSLKYPYAPPFHLDFDHEEDGCYVFHFFEVVTNEDESHTATVDWFTVDPKTGETTTITGETFNIGFYAADGNVECAPGYLFDRFLHGEIDAKVYNPLNPLESEGWDTFDYESVNISDLNFEPEEWSSDAFYLGDMLDLDNDGEDEFILDGPYGGMYFDVLDGDLYVFAAATGTAGSLKYTYYEGDCWIVYFDTTHSGRLCYWLYKYEGADNLVDSMTLMGLRDSEDNTEYTFNGESITEGEFVMIHNEIFGVKNLE